MGVLHPGGNLGRNLELSERRRALARKKRRRKRAMRKAARMKHQAARMKHQAARARTRLEELTFGTLNVRTAAVKGVNGIGHIDSLLRPCAAKDCDVIGLQETKRDGTSDIVAARYPPAAIAAGSKGGKGNIGLDWW